MTLGEKIVRLRRARGMSQEQLAERLAVSRQAVSKWELDAAVPDVARVVAISDLFGVTTDYLLKEEDAAGGTPPSAAGGARQSAPANDRRWLGMALVLVFAGVIIAFWCVTIAASVWWEEPLFPILLHIAAVIGLTQGFRYLAGGEEKKRREDGGVDSQDTLQFLQEEKSGENGNK